MNAQRLKVSVKEVPEQKEYAQKIHKQLAE